MNKQESITYTLQYNDFNFGWSNVLLHLSQKQSR